MLTAVKGYFKDGKVELSEVPEGCEEGPVIVTFLDSDGTRPQHRSQMIYRGMFKGEIRTNEEDFKITEWQGGDEDLRS